MNKNGFTLVELLAVVVLLSVLLVMAVPAVLSFTSRMKQDMFCNKVDTVVKSAQLFGQDNMSSITNGYIGGSPADKCKANGVTIKDTYGYECVRVSVSALLAKGYLTKEAEKKGATPKDFYDPRDGKSMKDRELFVYIKNKRPYAEFIFENEKDASLCDGTYYGDVKNASKR